MITSRLRYVREHPHALDLALSATLFVASIPGSLLTDAGGPHDWWPAVLCAAVACTALMWRRGHPRTTTVVTGLCAAAVAAQGYLLTVLILAPVMTSLYSLALHVGRRTARPIALGTIALLVAMAVIAAPDRRNLSLETIGPAAWLLIPHALGTSLRMRRAYLGAVQARAEHAEQNREEEARHRVAEERMRIARELHDVVAHHLALANAQAGTAAHLVRTNPGQAERILHDLTGTTSSALRELKATVGLLRQSDTPDAPLEPAPGLAMLNDLTASLATAGLTVTVVVEGREQPLSPGLDLTAYRIVQEALTNVTKHAATGAAAVRLAYSRDLLTVTVTDEGGGQVTGGPLTCGPTTGGPTTGLAAGAVFAASAARASAGRAAAAAATTRAGGPASDPPARGFGLIGMRERVLSVGGRLRAGCRPEGGFGVTAELPLHPDSRPDSRPEGRSNTGSDTGSPEEDSTP